MVVVCSLNSKLKQASTKSLPLEIQLDLSMKSSALFIPGRIVNFNVTGFRLPAAMVYTADNSVPSRVPTISSTEQQVVIFVQNTVMRSFEYVIYQKGRGAGLSDDLISSLLNQLDVTVSYKPLKCDFVFTTADGTGMVMNIMTNCQVLDGTVTKTCMTTMMNQQQMQMYPVMNLMDIDPMHLSISGTITTTNVVMANWSTQMWQIILNRALRSFTSGPLRSQFIAATVTLN